MVAEPVAAARLEAAVGAAPTTYSAGPEPATMITFTPMVGWRFATRRRSLLLSYVPRILWRHPNFLGLQRPLILHGATVQYADILSRGVQLTAGADWQYGEFDYLSVQTILGPTQTSSPQATVMTMSRIAGRMGLSHAYARRHQRQIGVRGDRYWFENVDTATAYPTQTSAGAELTERYVAGRRDNVDLTLGVTSTFLDWGRDADDAYLGNRFALVLADPRRPGERYDMGSLRAHWQRRLGPRSTLDLGTGVAGAVRPMGPVAWYPTGQAGVAGPLNRARRIQVMGTASIVGDAFFDRIYGGIRPTIGFIAGVTAIRPHTWTLGIRVRAATTATLEPMGAGFPESLVGMDVPFTYPLGSELTVEAGARMGASTTHWAAREHPLSHQYAWLYVAISWTSRQRSGH